MGTIGKFGKAGKTGKTGKTGLSRGVILVGHGGIPKDLPREDVMTLKRLESQRRATGSPPSAEELELDQRIRRWPRTPETDPYRAGLESLAARLRPLLGGGLFAIAYNEYCAPTLEEAAEDLIGQGAQDLTVVSSMATPGGSHSEIEIPETMERLRARHTATRFHYAWPFDLDLIAGLLAEHVHRFQEET